jgi:hypothetical protein
MKKCFVLITAMVLSFIFISNTRAVEIFFEYSAERTTSRAVEYERLLQMTAVGLRDIHILRIALDDPYIHTAPVTSPVEVGRRHTTTSLLSSAGAVAGVNADFFDIMGNYGLQLGISAYGGELTAANTVTNRNRDAFATFWTDASGYPFFQHMRVDVFLYIDGIRDIRINQFNNIGNRLTEPVAFTRTAMECTAMLDARFPDTVKIVSDGSHIINISQPGETVTLPEGGFVILFPANSPPNPTRYRVGSPAGLLVTNNLTGNFFDMQSAVGGAALLLLDGEVTTSDGYFVTGRHPRTAVGATYCGTTLILMVVDGRLASVGATHTELAMLMQRAGAHHAMHFDGGASSTMVVYENNRYSVVNTPAGGGQRAVVNALGIFDTASPGDMTGIVIEALSSRAVAGIPAAAVRATDARGLRFPVNNIEENDYILFANRNSEAGFWQDGLYIPLTAGEHHLLVWFGDTSVSKTIYVTDMSELRAPPVSTRQGETTRLRFSGTAADGSFLTDITVTDISVFPETLGRIENGHFIASEGGTGYIRARLGSAVTYVPISVGKASPPLSMLRSTFAFVGYPETVQGTATLTPMGTHMVSRLSYMVQPSEKTQAFHMVFEPPLVVPVVPDAVPTHLRMQVFGDASGHWLRGRVTDADGVSHTINFIQQLDFEGWDVVTAALPANLVLPFTLDRVWMAVLGAYDYSEHTVYFYNIQALHAPPPLPEVPAGTRFRDRLMTHDEFAGFPDGFNAVRTAPTGPWAYGFSMYAQRTAIVRLSAASSGLDDRNQWADLPVDVFNRNPRHVIIRINANPQRFQAHTFELFHGMMRTFVDEGRTVLVLFPGGNADGEAELTVRDGVRYIGARELHIFAYGDDIRWHATTGG